MSSSQLFLNFLITATWFNLCSNERSSSRSISFICMSSSLIFSSKSFFVFIISLPRERFMLSSITLIELFRLWLESNLFSDICNSFSWSDRIFIFSYRLSLFSCIFVLFSSRTICSTVSGSLFFSISFCSMILKMSLIVCFF